ncbi:MAG: YHS domain-containing protein [Polaromonas sp.]
MTIDPVCKMKLEPDKAAAKAEHAGQMYYFCSESCHKSFVADPAKYTSGAAPAEHACCGGHK